MSPALIIAEQDKHDTYQPLVNYAQLLVANPAFNCAAVSHSGEFSVGTFRAVEWLAAKEYIRSKSACATDGILPKEALGRLRAQLKDALATAVWGGWGATLRLWWWL